MEKKEKWISLGILLKNILEVYIPALLFMVLFASFLLGVFFRYVFNEPQSWTFELSTICYLGVGVLSWGIAHRDDNNVVFDMLYNKLSIKVQCMLRILSSLMIAAVAAVLVVPSINYMQSMAGLTMQVIDIPRWIMFLPFTVSFTAAFARSVYRLVLDVQSFANQEYMQRYGKKEETV